MYTLFFYILSLLRNPTGEPVQQPGTNTTTDWPPFTLQDMNHLVLEREVRLQKGYRQLNFSFWKDYIFKVSGMIWLKDRPQGEGLNIHS